MVSSKYKIKYFLAICCVALQIEIGLSMTRAKKIVCFWDSKSVERSGLGKFGIEDLKPALEKCTHLVYSSAILNNGKAQLDNPELVRSVIGLKKIYPNLKILLGIGGHNVNSFSEMNNEFLSILDKIQTRRTFINSMMNHLSTYGFDGADLAWKFPTKKPAHEPAKPKYPLGSIITSIEKTIFAGKSDDEKLKAIETHRTHFVKMLAEMQEELRVSKKYITLTILPNVDPNYFDVQFLINLVESFHIMTFDQKTPARDPNAASYPAMIYDDSQTGQTIDAVVRTWLDLNLPAHQLVLVAPAFARTWTIARTANPHNIPVEANGPGLQGPQTQIRGFLSYPEVCIRLADSKAGKLRKIPANSEAMSPVAYQYENPVSHAEGIWVAYEDPESIGQKGSYAKRKNLGGVGVWDLSVDDFRKVCSEIQYPLLSSLSAAFH